MKNKNYKDIILDIVVYAILIFLLIITIYPVWYVLIASFTSSSELASKGGFLLWPDRIMTGAYELAFSNRLFVGGFLNSIELLAIALPINLIMTLLCGYFMACTGMYWKKLIISMVMFTMFFSGGMIPGYLNVQSLGLLDTVWALVLPGALSVYNAIICKTAIEAVPTSLFESAYIDGANDLQIIWKIVAPLIKPTMAVLILYYGVGHWNSWFQASIYMKHDENLPVQNIIRSFLLANNNLLMSGTVGDAYNEYAESVKYAAIVLSTAPIMCVYPFLQKYFAKGVMIGAVKG